MEQLEAGLELGMILCKHCGALIGTFDAEKVTTYYAECKDGACADRRTTEPKIEQISEKGK